MKVAINGAGIAGSALAYWLHRCGHEVLLIERAPQFRTGGYIIDFWGVGYNIAERMGILPAVREAGYLVREVRLVDSRGHRVGGFSTEVFWQLTNGRFTSLPRGDLAAEIYRLIEGRVETLFNNSITGIEERASEVEVSFRNGPPRTFDLVVGADGLHSAVRQLAFGPDSQFETQLGYRVAAFEANGYPNRDELTYVSFGKPGRQVARFTLRGNRTMFLFVFSKEHLGGPDPDTLPERKALLHRIYGHLGWECEQILRAMDDTDELYYDRVSQIRMGQWSKGRVVLLGDAAACVSLLAGEGTGLAMAEAYILAGELKQVGVNYVEAFQRYEQRLRPLIEGKQKSARSFAGAFAPKTRFGLWFRNQVTKLMRVRFLAHYFVGRDLRDNIELPEYGL